MVKIDNPIKENVASKNCFCMLRFTLVYISSVQHLMNKTLLKYKNASLVLLRSRKYSKKPLSMNENMRYLKYYFAPFISVLHVELRRIQEIKLTKVQ